MFKKDLALNNLHGLIYHSTHPTKHNFVIHTHTHTHTHAHAHTWTNNKFYIYGRTN